MISAHHTWFENLMDLEKILYFATISHGILRYILSFYTKQHPQKIETGHPITSIYPTSWLPL